MKNEQIVIIIVLILIFVMVIVSFRKKEAAKLNLIQPVNEADLSYEAIDWCAGYDDMDINISYECHRQIWHEAGCTQSFEFVRPCHEPGVWCDQQPLIGLKGDKANWYNAAVAGIREPYDYAFLCLGQ